MAQKDPLVEYQREGYELFRVMMEAIKEESVGYLFNVEVETAADGAIDEAPADAAPAILAKGLEPSGRKPQHLRYTAPTVNGEAVVEQSSEVAAPVIDEEFGEVSRNQLCPCGSRQEVRALPRRPEGARPRLIAAVTPRRGTSAQARGSAQVTRVRARHEGQSTSPRSEQVERRAQPPAVEPFEAHGDRAATPSVLDRGARLHHAVGRLAQVQAADPGPGR